MKKKIFQTCGTRKQADIAIQISKKIDFLSKMFRRDKERHFIPSKGKIHQEDITVLSIYH